MERERNAGVDLLRILGIILIVATHVTPYNLLDKTCYWFVDINKFTNNMQIYLVRLLRFLGQTGNDIFIVSSAFFLTGSKKCKYKKIIYLFSDVCVWCIFYDIFFKYFFDGDNNIQVNNVPLNYWFVSAYICMYFLHPYFNILIDNLDKKGLLRLNIFNVSIWCILQLVLWGAFYLTELVSMIVIYFFVAYIKKYMQNLINDIVFNAKVFGVTFGCILCLNYLLPIIGAINDVAFHWYSFRTPLLVVNAISLYCIFDKVKIKSRIISYLSSFSILIYIIHGNSLVIVHVYSPVFKKIYDTYSYNYIFLWCIILSGIVLGVSFLMAYIYKISFQKLVYKVCDYEFSFISKLTSRLDELIEKWGGG